MLEIIYFWITTIRKLKDFNVRTVTTTPLFTLTETTYTSTLQNTAFCHNFAVAEVCRLTASVYVSLLHFIVL